VLEIESLKRLKAELTADVRALIRDVHVLLGCKMMAEMPEGYKIFFRNWLSQAEANYQKELKRIRRIGLKAYYWELWEKQQRAMEVVNYASKT